jgi:transcriptional regulator with XRE-family HTH domain
MLAKALGVSPALISSWESDANPAVPPAHRLEAYATFFATERSVESKPFRVLADLTEDERAQQQNLYTELIKLSDQVPDEEPSEVESPFDGTLWRYPPDEDVTIVCSELPLDRVEGLYTNPDMPDYVELYKYADLDALLELFGHVRAANPLTRVHVRIAAEMVPDEYATHLVLLGGVDWNQVTAELLTEIELPVRQIARPDDSAPSGFEVGESEQAERFTPVLQKLGQHEVLREDVAHFYRAPNPFNAKRTVTICNGTYQRGTLGVVRALTDERFRDRNDQYIRTRFAGTDSFSLISRVRVVNGVVITPDWTEADNRLHEWPAERRAKD